MNRYFLAAAALAFATGLVHSVFGELLILRRLRAARGPLVGIQWASWHLVALMGSCLGAMLVWLALPGQQALAGSFIAKAIVAAMLASSALVWIATKGRHPGWAALLGTAILAGLGM